MHKHNVLNNASGVRACGLEITRSRPAQIQVLTIDPVNPGGVPLQNWNHKEISRFCPHCGTAKDQSIWSEHVEFLHEAPTSPEALAVVEKRVSAVVAKGLPILVMEDSDHTYEHVVDNIFAFARFVTPGSYLIVQDTRMGKFVGPTRAVERFLAAQAEGEGQRRRQDGRNRSWQGHFERDRRPEYFIYSQHNGGFLYRSK